MWLLSMLLYPPFKRAVIDANSERKGSERRMVRHNVRSFVLGLIFHGNPLAVLGRISLVHVDAFKRMAGGARPHISHKLSWIFPSRANLNSSASVVFEAIISRVFASTYGVIKRLNCAGSVGIVGKPVGCLAGGKQFALQAAATPRSAGFELPAVVLGFIAAITSAKPNHISGGCAALSANDGQPSEYLSGYINWVCHR